MVGGGGIKENGFLIGQQFSLKFTNGKCIYPEQSQTTPGTNLVLPEDVCLSDMAKFFISERGNLQHVKTGFCIQPLNEELDDDQPIIIDEPCDKKWAFVMAPSGSLKLAESGKCIQPLSGRVYPSSVERLVFRDGCDETRNKFEIEGMMTTSGFSKFSADVTWQ